MKSNIISVRKRAFNKVLYSRKPSLVVVKRRQLGRSCLIVVGGGRRSIEFEEEKPIYLSGSAGMHHLRFCCSNAYFGILRLRYKINRERALRPTAMSKISSWNFNPHRGQGQTTSSDSKAVIIS